jgi:hypothetical protein
MGRQYVASQKRGDYTPTIAKSTIIWKDIQSVEIGLESSIQLLLQLWLLHPFLPIIMTWDTKELIIRCTSGLANFITFGIFPACYIEKSLFKILFAILLQSFCIAQMKKKPGQSFEKTVPMFVSIFFQAVGRIYALRSLVLMTTHLGYYKYALFFIVHFLLVFLIKTFFEVKALGNKIMACCQRLTTTRVYEVIKFITSGLASTIVMIHLSRGKQKVEEQDRTTHPSLLSHSAFQLVILLEHGVLVCLPFIASTYYPPADCFPNDSRTRAVWIVIIAWLVGALAQIVHYKCCTPLSARYGPQAASPTQMNCLTPLCCMEEVYKMELNLPHCTSCR